MQLHREVFHEDQRREDAEAFNADSAGFAEAELSFSAHPASSAMKRLGVLCPHYPGTITV